MGQSILRPSTVTWPLASGNKIKSLLKYNELNTLVSAIIIYALPTAGSQSMHLTNRRVSQECRQ
jgi:archaellin